MAGKSSIDREAPSQPAKPRPKGSENVENGHESDIGRALRMVYEDTIGEDVPPEMLELLGKLN